MKRLSVILLLIFSLSANAQTPPTQELETQIESVADGNIENQTDLLQVAENIQILEANPIEVNFADAEELEKIPYLNIFQIANLLQYRDRTGMIYSPYELQAVKGYDPLTIEKILPFLSFNTEKRIPDLKLKNIVNYSHHDLALRTGLILQERKGFSDSTENGYLGSPYNSLVRYRWRYRDYLSIGFVAQQDAGEPFGKPYQNSGVDFMAGHIALKNYGNLRKLIIGDYHAQFGQGLAMWSSLAFGKSAEAIEIKRYARGFIPFSGSEENRFMRGAAATYRLWDKLDVSAFYSKNKVDANRLIPDSLLPEVVTSFQTTGLHRTENELEDKNANTLTQFGGNLQYRGNSFSLGFTALNSILEKELQAGTQLYQKFRFSGTELTNYSMDFNYIFKRINLFGELAADDQLNLAGTVGFQSNPTDGLYLTLLYRNLSKEYQAIYNAPFGESGNYGEQGTYLGLQWQISQKLLLKSYVDVYQFKWLRFGVNAPSHGRDYMAQLETYFSRFFTAYLRLRHEVQQTTANNETGISQLTNRSRSTFRVHTAYSISAQLKMASRLEYSFYDEDASETGYMLFQDVKYNFLKIPLQLTARYALIDTESFNTRIYAYENDLTYVFSIPPYYGRSSRFYLMASYAINQSIDVQAKFANSHFYDRDEISSGLNTIEGNKLTEIRMQIRLKF
ncbi:ComEA family DNA-binding protein [Owenweeksia hongkongensis]|uniref:Helix-hairpin-helix domain-containing protein n=1 Tax=Owenweeksia hongkongensis (strain DSM 17368 / CIP 108786 / JCM 12287 / NRRL B-23963 / UST20020801) TaxID=926562 RepID=G8R186_OWEHD|nr:helix-hairpin-helix domain-containing protein [Owenweeksia hongkongensis]AEV32801.1 hypothetical protein Oweho_1821 [Owenweeksia hongkongensis DSM 17368]